MYILECLDTYIKIGEKVMYDLVGKDKIISLKDKFNI